MRGSPIVGKHKDMSGQTRSTFRFVDREAREERDAMIAFANLPIREQVLDRLADLMLDTDEILGFLDGDTGAELRAIVPEVQEIFDRMNRLMERLSD
jgi:hypothetical protein